MGRISVSYVRPVLVVAGGILLKSILLKSTLLAAADVKLAAARLSANSWVLLVIVWIVRLCAGILVRLTLRED